ncbi:DNA double-strand break repair nuclease NurA [Halobaculum sp. MBLA0147]|uniref:DNA double-strand break repair nuclease NurA n=1 Tax=Halobaculum sp. MBLA0147 TaxID=3079934 RepID=UPI00352603FF
MTLDRIHVDTVAHLASAIADGVDDRDHADLAERVWTDFLDPLYDEGREVVAPLGDGQELRVAPLEDAVLAERPFDTTHGVDSGTMNPTAFKNGLVLDVAQAAMAADPSELELHRDRTVLVTVHTTDATFAPAVAGGWSRYDDGHSERRVLRVPESRRFADETVHELALSLAESHHALTHADAVEELLVLDGPLYPKRLLNWGVRDEERRAMAHREEVREAVRNYVRLVERLVERDVPLCGFVKNPTSGYVTRTLSKQGVETPWPDDTALFTRLLERTDEDGERRTDALTFTSWFRSRGGPDEPMSTTGEALGVERRLDREAYEVTFALLYDPRTDVLFKIEAPYAVTRDPSTREALTRQLVGEVADRAGPPVAVSKADEIAGIGRGEKASLREEFAERFDSDQHTTYDDVRWDEE